ncbi:MAG: hypothetical protein QOH53_205, partial [Ilumatobacteraceae bacterium]
PYFMWREFWMGCDPQSPPGVPCWKLRPVGPIVHIWIAAILLAVLVAGSLGVGSALTRVNSNSDATIAKQLDNQLGLVIAAGAFSMLASLIFLALIRQLAARHVQATRES